MNAAIIEQALDEESFRQLRKTGIFHGWGCLELDAGASSNARWLAKVVAERRVEAGAGRIWRYMHKPLGRLRKVKLRESWLWRATITNAGALAYQRSAEIPVQRDALTVNFRVECE